MWIPNERDELVVTHDGLVLVNAKYAEALLSEREMNLANYILVHPEVTE
jgi:hypothetical protein